MEDVVEAAASSSSSSAAGENATSAPSVSPSSMEILPSQDSAANPPSKSTSLMDFGEEEEDDDDDLLATTSAAASRPSLSSAPKRKILIAEDEDGESAEEEEEELKTAPQRASVSFAPSARDEDDAAEEEEEEYEEEDAQSSNFTSVIEQVVVPNIEPLRAMFAKDVTYARFPRFLYVQGQAYDEETFDAQSERQEIQALNQEHAAGDLIVRHRFNKETGELESNTRLVEWEDPATGEVLVELYVGDEGMEVKADTQGNEFAFVKAADESEAAQRAADASYKAARSDDNEPFSLLGLARVSRDVLVQPGPATSARLEQHFRGMNKRAIKIAQNVSLVDPVAEQEKRIREEEANARNLQRRARRIAQGKPVVDEAFFERGAAGAARKPPGKRVSMRSRALEASDSSDGGGDDDEEEEDEHEMDDFIVDDDE